MLSHKTYQLHTSNGVLLRAKVTEFVSTQNLSIFTWPSSHFLSAFIATDNSNIFFDRRVLELGAGTSLPSIVAALIGARSVVITDRCNEPDIMKNIDDIIAVNNLRNKCHSMPLDWGLIDASDLASIGSIDIVLGADVFYTTEAFDSVLLTFVSILSTNPHAVFYTTYQERSNRRTLVPYLEKYGLQAETIPRESFLHSVHFEERECEVVSEEEGEEGDRVKIVTLDSYDNISLIKISCAS